MCVCGGVGGGMGWGGGGVGVFSSVCVHVSQATEDLSPVTFPSI